MGQPLAPGTWPALWLIVTVAIYGCVPETDHLEIVGAVLSGLLLAEIANGRAFNWGAQLAIFVVLVLVVRHGAVGQTRAAIGGAFAFWPLLLVTGWRLLAPEDNLRRTAWIPILVGGAAALIVSRTGALEPGWRSVTQSIVVWGSASLAVTGGALILVRRSVAGPGGASRGR